MQQMNERPKSSWKKRNNRRRKTKSASYKSTALENVFRIWKDNNWVVEPEILGDAHKGEKVGPTGKWIVWDVKTDDEIAEGGGPMEALLNAIKKETSKNGKDRTAPAGR